VRVVGTVEPDVEIADDLDGHLVGGESIENVSQLVEELLLRSKTLMKPASNNNVTGGFYSALALV